MSADVVVALGGGITAGGEPQPATVARARRAAALYRSGQAHRIVMSGAYGMYDPPPPRVEATAMAEIAVAAGVPPDAITAETRSRDTIGNIWFTKPLLGGPGRQRVIVVTSGWHAARVRYLAQVIWGPGYRVAMELTSETSTRPPQEIACWETGLLAVSRRWFATVRPGDDAAIAAILARDHPIYADHPQTTLAELAAMITRHPPGRGLHRTGTPIAQFSAVWTAMSNDRGWRQAGSCALAVYQSRVVATAGVSPARLPPPYVRSPRRRRLRRRQAWRVRHGDSGPRRPITQGGCHAWTENFRGNRAADLPASAQGLRSVYREQG